MRKALLLIAALTGLLVGLVALAVDDAPSVLRRDVLDQSDVSRIKALARRNDPRRFEPGEIREVAVSERDLNLLLDYGLLRIRFARAQIDLHDGAAEAFLTLELPANPFGGFLNASTTVSEGSGAAIVIDRVRLGSLSIPSWIANPSVRMIHFLLRYIDGYEAALEALKGVTVRDSNVVVTFQWKAGLMASLRGSGQSLLLPESERIRLLAWQSHLAEALGRLPRSSSLSAALPPLFAIARQRSAKEDAVRENRALLLSLGVYALGKNIHRLIGPPDSGKRVRLPRVKLTLRGRHDLAQHFLVSAAATVASGAGLADALGLFKELDDSIDGSGFSFADLAADRAGVRFAGFASDDPDATQERIASGLTEVDFMPAIDELPEGMMETEFRTRYREVESPAYLRMVAEIDRRIDSCALYR